jgi:hypothetical protein
MSKAAEYNQYFPTLLQDCFHTSQLFDFSGNGFVTDLDQLQDVVGLPFLLQNSFKKPGMYWQSSWIPLASLQQLPILVLLNAPIKCSLLHDWGRVYDFVTKIERYEPYLRYECSCVQGYERKGRQCQATKTFLQHGWAIAIVLFACLLAASPFVLLLVRAYRRRLASVSDNLELHESLLANRDEEVEMLVQSRRIAFADLELEYRIDGTSPGAFGEVRLFLCLD